MMLKTHSICKLVKNEDLNHHGTLFAGKTAMWFVESGFIAAANYTHPENIVCLKIHGWFNPPVPTSTDGQGYHELKIMSSDASSYYILLPDIDVYEKGT